MSGPDYSTWLTKRAAAAAIGVSTKTIEKLASDRQIEQAVWRRPTGGPPVAVFQPDDVARIASARRGEAVPFVLPAVGVGNGNGHRKMGLPNPEGRDSSTDLVPTGEDVLRLVFAAALRALSTEKPENSEKASQKSEPLWVTVKEAAAILGFPQADVRRLLHDGDLSHRETGRGGIRIRRDDLKALR